MPPKAPSALTFASFVPAALKPDPPPPEVQQPYVQRPQRCRCEGPFDLCFRYPATIPNAQCKATWDRMLAPFQFRGRPWTIIELKGLWNHTLQALNELMLKGRIERTLKEDLQDDVQVLIDLIQHSCKPHPRPPRAGMKTLIVQGRILAEAITQDALFQLDPADPSAPARPDRDLVDLIHRLRDRHPHSLLAPALHALRSLGNTAVHLDRDSAALAEAEIGDAAAVVCRVVVHVVDAHMQMCANLHRHEQTEAALAQPLEEGPVAPIPAPSVLLRPRPEAPLPGQPEEPAAPGPARPQARPPLSLAELRAHSGSHGSSGGGGEYGNGDAARPSGGKRLSGGGGGSHDGAPRVPYSLVHSDWAVAAAPHGSGGGGGGSPGASPLHGSRGWWPPLPSAEAAVLLAGPPPPSLLSRATPPPNALQQPRAAEPEADLLHSPPPLPTSYNLWSGAPAAPSLRRLSDPPPGPYPHPHSHTQSEGHSGTAPAASTPAPYPPTAPYTLTAGGSPQPHHHASYDPLGRGMGGLQPAGGSPLRSLGVGLGLPPPPPASLGPGAGLPRGSSPEQPRAAHPHLQAAAPAAPHAHQQHHQHQQPVQQAPAAAAGGGTAEASRRLLQLCAASQAPPGARVRQMLTAGATLAATDKSGMTALHMACYWGHTEAAEALLAAHPGGAAVADREGRTPLWVASQRGHEALVGALLQRAGAAAGLDAANASGVTPLRVAAAQGHAGVVGALLAGGANVEVADKDGFTPLYVAAARSHEAVAALLLAAGARPDTPDRAGRTPLWAALHPGGAAKAEASPERRAGVVAGLLRAGADVYLLADTRDRDYCWQLLAASIAAGE